MTGPSWLCVAALGLLLTVTTTQCRRQQMKFYFSDVAVRMPGQAGRRYDRESDPSFLVPHLYQGDVVEVSLCVPDAASLTIDNVTHSNDGPVDTVQVLLDGTNVETFTTPDHSNWGQMWQVFVGTGRLGPVLNLTPGRHTLTFKVVTSDCYGVEIGTLYTTIDAAVKREEFWCGSTFVLADIQPDCASIIPPQPVKTPAPLPTTAKIAISTTVKRTSTAATSTTTAATTSTSSTTSTSTTKEQTTKPLSSSSTASGQTKVTESATTATVATATDALTTLSPGSVMVAQHSYSTECLDERNVRVTFSVPSLQRTRIISRTEYTAYSHTLQERSKVTGATTCSDTVMQLGVIDDDNAEFGPHVSDSIVYYSVKNTPNLFGFPRAIYPNTTRKIVLRFSNPVGKIIDKGSAYFALGLVNVTGTRSVALRYYDNSKRALSEAHYVTFTPKYRVIGWNLRELSQSANGQSEIHLEFDKKSGSIKFDFMRLDYSAVDERKENVVIKTGASFRVRGLKIKNPDKGMDISVNGKKSVRNIEKLAIFYRPVIWTKFYNVLNIDSDGFLFPYHKSTEDEIESQRQVEKSFIDVSGFVVGAQKGTDGRFRHPVQEIAIWTSTQNITIRYRDQSELSLQLVPTATDTQLFILDSQPPPNLGNDVRMPGDVITFVSTHVTDYLAAVNHMTVDGLRETPVMFNLSQYSGGQIYTFTKTSPTMLFRVSHILELLF